LGSLERSPRSGICFAVVIVFGALAGPAAIGCADDERSAVPPASSGPTWHKDVQPIIEDHCQGCHVSGGIAPFALTTYEEASAHAAEIVFLTQAGLMPPWPPDDSCRPIQHSRALAAADLATLAAWQDAGKPLGNLADARAPLAPVEPPVPDLRLAMAQRYLPDQTVSDDYRCFIVDPGLEEDRFVTGFAVYPGNHAVVHHVLVYAAEPADLAAVMALDGADGRPGYTCYGGPGVDDGSPIGGWAPGVAPIRFAAGTGIKVAAGSRMILQLHYNTTNAPGADDRSEVGLFLAPVGSQLLEAINAPLRPDEINVRAGDPDGVAEVVQDLPFAGRVYSVAGHMHGRGTRMTARLTHADGSEDCVLDIPDWDFHWQGTYQFVTPLEVVAGDKVTLTCHYDNSAAGQPRGPDGRPTAPADLHWGEKSSDEMCLLYAYLTFDLN